MAYEADMFQQLQAAPKLNYDCLLFDIDDTIYPFSSGLSHNVTRNIQEYMVQKLGVDDRKVSEICLLQYKQYGTTMAGLKATGYNFDYNDYHRELFILNSFSSRVIFFYLPLEFSVPQATYSSYFLVSSFVHGRLPYELLKPDPILRNLLHSLPIRKVIFTNADKAHVAKVLSRLGLEDCFDGVICFETLNSIEQTRNSASESSNVIFDAFDGIGSELPKTPIICKPFKNSFEQVFELANINPQRTLFFDESIRNIQSGKTLGLHTVLVGIAHRIKGADHALESIHSIREALPELWEATEKSERIVNSRKVALETTVRA